MGNLRSGAGRSGAQALPLTRRQQKQARQRKANQQARQRRTQPPPAREHLAPARPAHDEELTRVVAPPAMRSAEPAVPTATRKTRARRKDQADHEVAADATTDVASAGSTPMPIIRKTRRVARTLAQAVKTVNPAPAPKKPSASAAGERKYPTLARMAAIAPRPEHDTAASRETSDEEPPRAMPDESLQDGERGDAADPALANGHGHVGDLVETRPAPTVAPLTTHTAAMPRRPTPTRRLASVDPWERASSARNAAEASQLRARPESGARALLAENLVVPLAALHVGIAAAAALMSAGLLVEGVGQPLWPLTLAGIAGTGGWLGYALAVPARRLAASALLLTELSLLAWLLVLIGARGAILALAPAVVLLALLWLGRAAACAVTAGALLLYALAALTLNSLLTPAITLPPDGYVLLDGAFIAAGLLAMVVPASHLHRAQVRAELAAQALRHETRTLRARLSQTQRQVEDDAERLNEALTRALAGQSAAPIETDGILSLLVETTDVASERLVALQQDREERLRLEGAVRIVTQAVERAWLGLPWSWPDWSGTALDELVALLRTPRPREAREDWSDETPTLTAIPTAERGMTPRPWEQLSPDSGPISSVRMAWSPSLLSGRQLRQRAASLAAEAQALPARLPWDEWDEWREWVAARDD